MIIRFLFFGLLELYEATFEVKYLEAALELTNECSTLFWMNIMEASFLHLKMQKNYCFVKRKSMMEPFHQGILLH